MNNNEILNTGTCTVWTISTITGEYQRLTEHSVSIIKAEVISRGESGSLCCGKGHLGQRWSIGAINGEGFRMETAKLFNSLTFLLSHREQSFGSTVHIISTSRLVLSR
jgi:hypothetical protein